MNIKEKSANHKLGAFYTPSSISSYISKRLINFYLSDFNSLEGLENKTVLDPACGDAALLKAFENELNSILSVEKLDSVKADEKTTQVYGIDINPLACEESKNNVSEVLKFGRTQSYLNADALSLLNKKWKENNLFPQRVKEFLKNEVGVDFILTNPPWGVTLDLNSQQLKESGYELAYGQYDSYEIMTELSLKLLKKDGYMALILPDSLFLHQHKNFREFLLKNTTIKLIYRLGEGFFPGVFRSTVLIIIKNKPFSLGDEVICLNLNKEQRRKVIKNELSLIETELENSHLVPQNRFLQDKDYRLDIDVSNSPSELNLIRKIEKFPSCWDYFESGRGIEIAKSGAVQVCRNCNAIFPKSKSGNSICKNCETEDNLVDNKIIDKNPLPGWEPLLVGEDIHRYSINSQRYINPNLNNYNYKNRMLKSTNPKLLVRKTGLGISASIDYENRYTLQTVFHFIKKEETPSYITVEYVLGVLNSRVLLYYHLKKSGEMEWKSHPYVTQSSIKEFPIPLINKDDVERIKLANEISSTVKKILSSNKDGISSLKLDLKIESLVMQLYGISKEEYEIINCTINNAEQLKSISALKIPSEYAKCFFNDELIVKEVN